MSRRSRREFLATAGAVLPAGLSLPVLNHGAVAATPKNCDFDQHSASQAKHWSVGLTPDNRHIVAAYAGAQWISSLRVRIRREGKEFASDARTSTLKLQKSGDGFLVHVAGERNFSIAVNRAERSLTVALKGIDNSGAEAWVEADLDAGRDPIHARPSEAGDILQMKIGRVVSDINDVLYDRFRDEGIRVRARETKFSVDAVRYRVSAGGTLDRSPLCSFEIIPAIYSSRLAFFALLDKDAWPHAPAGWCSWYYYFARVTEADILKNAVAAARDFARFGLEYCLIDAGWQLAGGGEHDDDIGGSWSQPNTKFPDMKRVADAIRATGLRPGLWLSVFGNSDPEFYTAHKEWFLHDASGNPRIGGWFGTYVADFSNPEVREHLYEVYRHHATDWNFDYFKLDGENDSRNVWAENRARVFDPTQNADEAFRLTLRRIHQGMATKPGVFFSACGPVYPLEAMGIAQAARLGGDVVADSEPPSFRGVRTALDAIRRGYFTHNIGWYGDPDVLVVREPLSLEEARTWASILGLTGQLLMLGDDMTSLSEERKDVIRKILPVADVTPMHLHPLSGDAERWILHVERGGTRWAVAGLFNWNTDGEEMLDPDMARASEIMARNDALLGTHHSWGEGVAICSRVSKVRELNHSYEGLSVKPDGLQLIPVPVALTPIPPKKINLSFSSAGLDRDRVYLLFDFWEQKFLGRFTNEYSIELPSHACQVISLRPEIGRPQLIGTDRHLTMGGIELRGESWDPQAKKLTLALTLVPDYPTTVTIHASGKRLRAADASSGFHMESNADGELVCCHVQGAESRCDLAFTWV